MYSKGFGEWSKGDGQASAFRQKSLLLEGVILVAEGASFPKGQCIAVDDGYHASGEIPDGSAVQPAQGSFFAGSGGLSISGVNRALTSRSRSCALVFLLGL